MLTLPLLGLGTWPLSHDEAAVVVADGIAAGYRLIDTAQLYRNEIGVGQGLRASGLDRSELFVTSKLPRASHRDARQAVEQSLEAMGLDYLDLMLIHWPNPDLDLYVEAWQGLIDARSAGLVRAIGVSNFLPANLDRLTSTGVTPLVNQIECSPALTRTDLRARHEELGIVTQSYSPIGGQGVGVGLLSHPVVLAVAASVERTPAQVILRWHLELGLVPVVKSSNTQRLRENLAVFDFTLTPEQVAQLSALDHGEAAAFDAETIRR